MPEPHRQAADPSYSLLWPSGERYMSLLSQHNGHPCNLSSGEIRSFHPQRFRAEQTSNGICLAASLGKEGSLVLLKSRVGVS